MNARPAKLKIRRMKIMHKKSHAHLLGHIAYAGLYGVLIISTIFLYNLPIWRAYFTPDG